LPVYVFWLSFVLLWIIALFLLGATLTLTAHIRNGVQSPLETIRTGEVMPTFEATNETRRIKVSDTDFKGKRTLILFVSSTCNRCQDMAGDFGLLTPQSGVKCLVACVGDSVDCDHYYASANAFATVVHDRRGKLAKIFRAGSSPTAMVFDENGRLEVNVSPSGVRQLAQLLNPPEFSASESGRVAAGCRG
jgi:thioredoxin-related protein